MNNTDTTITAATSTAKFANVSEWISVSEAKALISKLIADGVYKANELTRSSNIFTNRKDKSDGYSCRVRAIAGIHPELEIAPAKRGRKPKAKVEGDVKKVPGKRGRKPKKHELALVVDTPLTLEVVGEPEKVEPVAEKPIESKPVKPAKKANKAKGKKAPEKVEAPVEVVENEVEDIWFEAV